MAGSFIVPNVRGAQPCPPPQISVAGGSAASTNCSSGTLSSVLSVSAAAMPAGSWAQLTVSNQNSVLGVGSVSGSMIHYCNKMPWNPISKKIEMLAMDHNYGSVRYAQYDAAANAFVLVTNDAGFGSSVQHGYDHNVVNPYTGDLYYRRAFTGSSALTVAKKAFASAATFSTLPTINTYYQQIGIGACWWSGALRAVSMSGSASSARPTSSSNPAR